MDPLVTTFLFFFGGLAFVVGTLALIKSGEDAEPQRKKNVDLTLTSSQSSGRDPRGTQSQKTQMAAFGALGS